MTRQRYAAVTAALAAVALAFVLGRATVRCPEPPAVALKTAETATRNTAATTEAATDAAATTTVASVQTRWRTRTVYHAGGTIVVEREGTRAETDTRRDERTVSAATTTATSSETATRTVDLRVVSQPSRPWSASAVVGWTRLQARPDTYGVLIQRDVGRVRLGAMGMRGASGWAGFLTAGLEF